jgi:hypothetical protein
MEVTAAHDKEHGHDRVDSIKKALAYAFAEHARTHRDGGLDN